ncbi:hypothetical protein ABB37_04653 [Leptomonas pyrrhocoris]|uniref:Uncharacterized protein n=1 Tax=Leptomonas pyrrhocoris TaxID=157538 RepID=A0A0N0DVI6_LEPPY|nr:hypothetical protein ABB37_04653 [Leptomonas pyrrhocoris]KPA80414.1 hypothetical protein ABB37_04653 [Leptomonas pyrrhocoris]|eukprot:XP_015658853.1 hypothetical protein ABB37_04653 [Leptomonas pyrrhocoris]
MSCERIDPKDFHGPAATQYTQNSLQELANNPQFRSYVHHVEYKERLYLTWFLAPFTLFGVLYFHLAMFGSNGVNLFMEPSARSELVLRDAPLGVIVATLILLFYAIPCIIISPFAGFFEEQSRWASLAVLLFTTGANVAAVSFGGPRLHYPPFLTTSPTLPEMISTWSPMDIAGVFVRDILVRRALCLEGFVVAGYAVAVWRRSYWRRAWHPPLPLLTIPLSVGLAGVGWWVVFQKAIPLFLDALGTPTPVAEALHWSAVQADPMGAVNLCGRVVKEIVLRLQQDVLPLVERRELPFAFRDASACLSLYLAASSMALVHLLLLFAKPVLDFVVDAFFFLLPTDPTVWGLAMLASIGSFVSLWRAAEGSEYAVYLASLACLAAALLFNGFVA